MKIEDILAPWEYSSLQPPKLCEVYRFPLMWRGEKKAIFAALIAEDVSENDKYLAFRVEGDDASWTLGGKDGSGTQKFYSRFAPSCSIVERRIKAAFQSKSLYRQFAFKCNEEPDTVWTVTLSALGAAYGTQQVGGRTTRDTTRFCFSANDLLETNAKNWLDRLTVELENPDSDAVYSRQFFSLGLIPRRARMLGVKSQSETEQLLAQLISLWKMVAIGHSTNGANKGHVISLTVQAPAEVGDLEKVQVKAHPANPRLQFWAETFVQKGLLPLDFSSLRKYTALLDTFKKHGYQLALTVPLDPTYHERLESKVQLLE